MVAVVYTATLFLQIFPRKIVNISINRKSYGYRLQMFIICECLYVDNSFQHADNNFIQL